MLIKLRREKVTENSETFMPIWKLEPENTDAVQWQVSKYVGEIIVKAETEDRAREIVGYCLWQTGHSADANIAGPPWNNRKVVIASRYTQGDYDTSDAAEEVLAPAEAVAHWKQYLSEI